MCRAYDISPNLDTRMAVLGLTGAVLGAIVGAGAKSASWVAVPLHSGVTVGVSLSF